MVAITTKSTNSLEWGIAIFCHSKSTFVLCTLDYFCLTSVWSLFRYAYPWWKEKVIDSELKRKEGFCPLTPEETSLVLSALGIDRKVQIYIASGEIYGGERRMESLAAAFPNLVSWWNWELNCVNYAWIGYAMKVYAIFCPQVRKETLLKPSDLRFFQNHSSQMAALDYLVSLESDIFVPTYDGNMAKVVEGHRR